MSNDAEIQMAVLAKGLPGVRHVLATGLPLESDRAAYIKSLRYSNKELRSALESLQAVSDARMAVIDDQRREIAQLKAALGAMAEALETREQQLHEIAVAAQAFVERKDSEIRQAQRDSRSAQEAMHRMWNEKLTGGAGNAV